MSNKKAGNDFEQEFCKILADKGFWVHNMANRQNGQPADVIAVKNGSAYLIDCKVCAQGVFKLSRIEENQRYAMQRWVECGNGSGAFAMKCGDKIYIVPLYSLICAERQGMKCVDMVYMSNYGMDVDEFDYMCSKRDYLD